MMMHILNNSSFFCTCIACVEYAGALSLQQEGGISYMKFSLSGLESVDDIVVVSNTSGDEQCPWGGVATG